MKCQKCGSNCWGRSSELVCIDCEDNERDGGANDKNRDAVVFESADELDRFVDWGREQITEEGVERFNLAEASDLLSQFRKSRKAR